MHKFWYKKQNNSLSKQAKEAKTLVERICRVLSYYGKRQFFIEMNCWNNTYEGHIIDTGKCIEVECGPLFDTEFKLSENGEGETIGMIFWGGFFDRRKYKDALSNAWISLLEDCIGLSSDFEIRHFHNLTKALKTFGPQLDFRCSDVNDLKKKLEIYEKCI